MDLLFLLTLFLSCVTLIPLPVSLLVGPRAEGGLCFVSFHSMYTVSSDLTEFSCTVYACQVASVVSDSL